MNDYEKYITLLEAEINNSPPEIATEFRKIITRVNSQIQQDTEVPPPLTDEQLDVYLNSVSCPECWGTGRVYAYVGSQPSKCTSCDGTGSL